uniref:Uncharacterized protein n=1 Tax=Nelumbo nucifera TaxID=4432 RepID=A0A822XKQ6_NELNU|nr:TPA_asm: hypothetical protein HUJ06_021766 [Nelumbo nucifera]
MVVGCGYLDGGKFRGRSEGDRTCVAIRALKRMRVFLE